MFTCMHVCAQASRTPLSIGLDIETRLVCWAAYYGLTGSSIISCTMYESFKRTQVRWWVGISPNVYNECTRLQRNRKPSSLIYQCSVCAHIKTKYPSNYRTHTCMCTLAPSFTTRIQWSSKQNWYPNRPIQIVKHCLMYESNYKCT